jgi:dihydroorotate dehydrogenase (fumarate)
MDLSTTYMGLDLPGPLVASASPLNARLDNLLELQAMGAGAVVLPSVFEEQIERDAAILEALIDHGGESYGEALSYFPPQTAQSFDTERQFDLLEQAARRLDIPVIASLNGITDSGWIDYAQRFQDAGASAIELNIFLIPSDPTVTGEAVEARYVDVTAAVAASVDVPVAVKIGPYFSSPGHLAGRLVAAGARGLVLFNRFFQPDIDPDTLSVEPSLALSNGFEMRLPLLWIGVLAGRLDASLGAHVVLARAVAGPTSAPSRALCAGRARRAGPASRERGQEEEMPADQRRDRVAGQAEHRRRPAGRPSAVCRAASRSCRSAAPARRRRRPRDEVVIAHRGAADGHDQVGARPAPEARRESARRVARDRQQPRLAPRLDQRRRGRRRWRR